MTEEEMPKDLGDLTVKHERAVDPIHTGIYVRAKNPDGKWVSTDISTLDRESLNAWLRSRDGANDWAEAVMRILLSHKEP